MSVNLQTFYAPHPTPERSVGYFLTYNNKVDRMVYPVDTVVYMRGMTDSFDVGTYTQHNARVTCCSYNPDGRWIASGEETGVVRVWTPQNAEQILRVTTRPIAGPILDMSWTDDSGRIAVIGRGANSYGSVINSETGSQQGEVMGHTRPVNTGALKPNRPFRLVTAGDDCQHIFYKGPPFKFEKSVSDHDKFILCIRYAPDGSVYGSVGLDGKLCIYKGDDGTLMNTFEFPSGITCLSFSPDSTKVLLSLMNGQVLVVNVADGAILEKFEFGSEVYQQQAGVLWTANHRISVSLNGNFNFLDGDKVTTIRGHGVGISGLCRIPGGFATGDGRGLVLFHKYGQIPHAFWHEGGGYPAVKGLAAIGDGQKILAALSDSTVVIIDSETGEEERSFKFDNPVLDVVQSQNVVVMMTRNSLIVFRGVDSQILPLSFEPLAIAIASTEDEIAVGDGNGFIHFFNLAGEETGSVKSHAAPICCIAYSAEGDKVASSSTRKDITVWQRGQYTEALHEGWIYHSLPITRLLFLPGGTHLISVSKDRTIRQWSLQRKRKTLEVPKAHAQMITNVMLIDDNHIITTGDDGAIKTWEITLI